ncbi:transmembrane protein 120B isoform X3 [Protopterus annectens]|uniref:transmembrane protein 120B isoform X3 n=1 Tax=Protopterus annectens TaxID=7888 RepID=UPI001CFA8A71|nr:transmembrane protein 120B isoform X3 [Protopterus annectens]
MSLQSCIVDWGELDKEFHELQETHKIYRQKLDEVTHLQTICANSIKKHKKRLADLRQNLLRSNPSTVEHTRLLQTVNDHIKERNHVFFDMEAYLPKNNGLYLKLVLGNVNVTLLSNQAKFAYKDEYEKFKLYLTIILLLCAVSCMFFLNYRVTDEIFNFLLVWYYCTLTIRESILISNGSRLCSVSSVLLPEWLPLQTSSTRGEKPLGSYSRWIPSYQVVRMFMRKEGTVHTIFGSFLPQLEKEPSVDVNIKHHQSNSSAQLSHLGIPVLDVERVNFPASFPVFWAFLAAVHGCNTFWAVQT